MLVIHSTSGPKFFLITHEQVDYAYRRGKLVESDEVLNYKNEISDSYDVFFYFEEPDRHYRPSPFDLVLGTIL